MNVGLSPDFGTLVSGPLLLLQDVLMLRAGGHSMFKALTMLVIWMGVLSSAQAATKAKWTMLVYFNGHNNLASYVPEDINEMEKVGSTPEINLVVQWAGRTNKTTNRYLVKKDTNLTTVTSPIVQALPTVDMGDYRSLIDFAQWGIQNYPAEHYFLVVWNHGGGWDQKLGPRDISWDDFTHHVITTEQLGFSLNEIAKFAGQPIDIYGNDACLMSMPEVSAEMDQAVKYFIGSEENEPGDGWPYDDFLSAWVKTPNISALEISKLLAATYRKSYENGSQGLSEVTLSAFDLSKSETFYQAVANLSREIRGLSLMQLNSLLQAAQGAQYYDNLYYRDLGDFINKIGTQVSLNKTVLNEVKAAISSFVVANERTSKYQTSQGVSIWLPTTSADFSNKEERYSKLKFNLKTDWHSALKILHPIE